MSRIITNLVYNFNELSTVAKYMAMSDTLDLILRDDRTKSTIYSKVASQIELLGIKIHNFGFSVSTESDVALLISYVFCPAASSKLKEIDADPTLYQIAGILSGLGDTLCDISDSQFLICSGATPMTINQHSFFIPFPPTGRENNQNLFFRVMTDVAEWASLVVRNECDRVTSESHIIEYIKINELEFWKDGALYSRDSAE